MYEVEDIQYNEEQFNDLGKLKQDYVLEVQRRLINKYFNSSKDENK